MCSWLLRRLGASAARSFWRTFRISCRGRSITGAGHDRRRWRAENLAPVNFIRWILIMASSQQVHWKLPATSPHSSETMMRFYNQQHRFYCGVDLHARTLALHVLDAHGQTLLALTIAASPDAFLQAVAPFRDGLVVACECMFAWYWLADLCHEQGIPFVLGHALYMKAIHGGKAKTDKIDAKKIAVLLRGGMLPRKKEISAPVHRPYLDRRGHKRVRRLSLEG